MNRQRSLWRRGSRPLRHFTLSVLLHGLSYLARLIPLALCQRWGSDVGLIIRACLPRQRAMVLQRLIDVQEALKRHQVELNQLERLHWIDLGRRVGEWLAGERALSLFWISSSARQVLIEARQQSQSGKAIVVCTSHYGHWELMAAWLSRQGFDFLAIASSPPRGPFGAWLSAKRASMGVTVIHPHGGAKHARRHLAQGGVVALLVDHSTQERSISSPFLGQAAPHAETADRLIRSAQAMSLWVCSRRDEEGRYEVVAHKLSGRCQTTQDPIPNTREAHVHLEQLIIESPQQWLWLHRRWEDRDRH